MEEQQKAAYRLRELIFEIKMLNMYGLAHEDART